MASRMERYNNKTAKPSRSSRNKSLYNSIYSYDDKYSNIEGVASIDKSNEIDISKVKKMLETRENSNRKQYDESKEFPETEIFKTRYKEDLDRNYDIMDVLKTAKENKKPDNKERVLNNTGYDILKKLNLKSESEENDKEELQELIKTISQTSMLNKDNQTTDEDIDMFADLVSDDTQVGDVKDFTQFTSIGEKTMDDSFFTGGVKLKKADFVNGSQKKGSFIKTFFLFIIILSLLAGAVFLTLKYFNII